MSNIINIMTVLSTLSVLSYGTCITIFAEKTIFDKIFAACITLATSCTTVVTSLIMTGILLKILP